ncbi:hypothetical protein [Lactiplantibacillus herbarum]|uniref:hypothetical protein n=1 Tax=Lactiplantibacillus herbarum TaxID=1670446 RepID=UPI00064FF686|nr:hypothetical protein [Lactiplantibacillus herbarum]
MSKYYIDGNVYVYPQSYDKLIELNLVDFDTWYLIESDQATRRYYDLKERYPDRRLVPFARKDSSDDIACFEIGKGKKVQLIHDFASAGWEQRGEFNDLWDWLKFAINDMVEFNREDGIE